MKPWGQHIIACVLSLLISHNLWSQAEIRGQVLGESAPDQWESLIGANVVWLGTSVGVVTDLDGNFSIEQITDGESLVISFVGYRSDTIEIADQGPIEVILKPSNVLDDVEVVHRRKSTEYSFLDPRKVEQINESELLKAACCNLSESFETNPSIDVSFTDAVTGVRQIQMLGLAGPYIQITRENIPFVRGLAANTGLTYVPGTWVEGMQLSKGSGSVVNGFESISGQINIELRKPEDMDQLYLNLYANEGGRFEGNANFSAALDDRWSTAILLHGNRISRQTDRNGDGFRDMASSGNFIGLNRWKYSGDNGIRLQAGIKHTNLDQVGGQLDFDPANASADLWGSHSQLQRWEGWLKLGKVYEALPWRSWAIQAKAVDHRSDNIFGNRVYDATQQSLYLNLLYQSIIGNTHHQILTGASMQYDHIDEVLADVNYERQETVPGVFSEYTFGGHEKFSLVAGLRVDHHNNYGLFMTPRLHLRYAFSDELVMRAGGGRGLRTANIIAENMGILASNRRIIIESKQTNTPYGLQPEIAWNFGTNLVQSFRWNNLPGSFTIDFYHTSFSNQIVLDLDESAQDAFFYNLDGRSFSNSLQFQVDYEVLPRVNLRMAYRWYDVKTDFRKGLLPKPLLAQHRFFFNVAFETENGWAFDYTVNLQGEKRLPNTQSNPEEFRLAEYSDPFMVMNAQITKSWKKTFDIYLGGENLLNYRQPNAIIASRDPFTEYFDASLIWGPIFGRNIYLGLRYKI